MKEYFEQQDNLIDKHIKKIRDDLNFIKRRNIQPFMLDLIQVYANFFTGGNLSKAKNQLDQGQSTMSVTDLLQISFLSGLVACCVFIQLYFAVFKP